MRRITALWESFFSKDLYSEAFFSWKGIGFLSILIITLIHSVIIFGKIHFGMQGFVHRDAPAFVKQIPPITFKSGKASTPEPIAYQLKAPDSGEVIAIIDTRVAQPPIDLGGAPIFIAGEKATFKKSEVEQRSYEYNGLEDMTVDQNVINHWLNLLADWAGAICTPFVLGFLLIWRLLQMLFFSIVTLIICKNRKIRGSYAALLRITALALIPGLVYSVILSAASVDFFGSGLLFFVITIGYIVFGVDAVKHDTQPEESEIPPPPLP